jgi:hypothetical protein
MQKYKSDVRVTDLPNMYSMSKSTISTITHIIQPFFIMKRLGKGCFGSFGTHYGYFHYFLWEKIVLTYDQLELRPTLAKELSS